jgi:glycosyltransferase involved in cell wall biosynthesis
VEPVVESKPIVVAIMPARNNAKTLRAAVRRIPAGSVNAIVLVDNRSRDETVKVAEELGLDVVRHDSDRGYGGSLKSCLDRALALGADLIAEVHPDDQYGAEALPELIRKARETGCALVIGRDSAAAALAAACRLEA